MSRMGFFSGKMDKQIASYQQELMETHYHEVDNMYRQIRGWRHDYRNLIQKMKAYAASVNCEAIIRYLDLLDANRVYLDAQVEYSNAVMDEYIALVDIYKALGGGWQPVIRFPVF